jgi:2-(3-amino-3-carboxypropyl)histidine synthase
VQVLYVFVEIQFETSHLVETLTKNFDHDSKLALLGTIQFTNMVHSALADLKAVFPNLLIPQVKPLSPGTGVGQ